VDVKGHYTERNHFLSALTRPSVTSAIQRAVIFLKKLTLDLVKNTKVHCYVLEEGKERKSERRKRDRGTSKEIYIYSLKIVRSSPHSVYLSRTLTEGKNFLDKRWVFSSSVQDMKCYNIQRIVALLYKIRKTVIFSEKWPFCKRSEGP
jgi:hypothetical protein